MTTPAITYQTLMTAAINKVSALCNNVANFGGVPAEYKSGYSNVKTQQGSGGRPITLTLTTTIASGAVSQVTAATVSSQMNAFFNDRGITAKANKNITDRGLANFYNNIAAFCYARVFTYSSQMTSTNIIVYNSGNVTYPSVTNIDESSTLPADIEKLKIIVANQDVTLALQLLGSYITSKIRGKATKYNRTLTHTGRT